MIARKHIDVIIDAIRDAKPAYRGLDAEETEYERGREHARAIVASYLVQYFENVADYGNKFSRENFLRRCYLTDDAVLFTHRLFSKSDEEALCPECGGGHDAKGSPCSRCL